MTSSWYINFEPVADPVMRLICFPYAGGSASVFYSLVDELPQGVDLWAANLPGHGSRLCEVPLMDMKAAAQQAAAALVPLSDRPFAFLGYSLGARLAFEAARVLRRQGKALLLHLFVAAAPAPQIARYRQWHRLADDALLVELQKYGGLPQQLLDEPDLLALFLPALRADLTMIETSDYDQERPFAFPITVLGGNRDSLVNVEELEAWQEQTTAAFRMNLFDSDHFFLRTATPSILQSVADATRSVRNE